MGPETYPQKLTGIFSYQIRKTSTFTVLEEDCGILPVGLLQNGEIWVISNVDTFAMAENIPKIHVWDWSKILANANRRYIHHN